MIILDSHPLELDALNDPKHKLHDFAKEYDDTLKELYARYTNGFIRFKRPGFPRYTKGMDEQGREIPKMAFPTPPMRIPLKAYATTGKLGKHLWMCCLDTPTVLANGLWDMGRKRAMSIKEDILVDIKKEPDLAFFLYRISPFVRRGLVKIADPVADDKKIGEEQGELTERKYAVWNLLSDEAKLKTMARAYGINNAETKQPNALRQELENTLEKNDALKKQNPIIKGTREFLEEMKITDNVLLRNFVQKAIDDKKLEYRADGRWKIGEKNIIQVPASDLGRTKEYLCDYLMAGNHIEKLQEFLKDLINKEYLEGITEKKEWVWLAKVANIPHEFKEAKKVTENVTAYYCPV
jgi:hypothetical protein